MKDAVDNLNLLAAPDRCADKGAHRRSTTTSNRLLCLRSLEWSILVALIASLATVALGLFIAPPFSAGVEGDEIVSIDRGSRSIIIRSGSASPLVTISETVVIPTSGSKWDEQTSLIQTGSGQSISAMFLSTLTEDQKHIVTNLLATTANDRDELTSECLLTVRYGWPFRFASVNSRVPYTVRANVGGGAIRSYPDPKDAIRWRAVGDYWANHLSWPPSGAYQGTALDGVLPNTINFLPFVLSVGALTAMVVATRFTYRCIKSNVHHARGLCVGCGYSVRGLMSTLCPECGIPTGGRSASDSLLASIAKRITRYPRVIFVLRTVAGVVVGYLFMAILAIACTLGVWASLGVDGLLQPGTFRGNITFNLSTGLIAAITSVGGGWVCRKLGNSTAAPKALAGLIFVIAMSVSIAELGKSDPRPRAPGATVIETLAQDNVQTPTWLALLYPAIGTLGVLAGSALVKKRRSV